MHRVIGKAPDEPVTGQIPLTPPAKKVLELSLREALSLGDNFIDTEHILLGLIRENEGLAASLLVELGSDARRSGARSSAACRERHAVGGCVASRAGRSRRRCRLGGSTGSSGPTRRTGRPPSGSTRSEPTAGSSSVSNRRATRSSSSAAWSRPTSSEA